MDGEKSDSDSDGCNQPLYSDGCNNRAEVDTLSPAQAAELKPMPQSWRGVLPCADCEGIETSCSSKKDGTWVMNERYLGAREEPSSFASYGTWCEPLTSWY